MVNIEMFRHPKYYKELRKLRNKSDQVISETKPTGDGERAPGQGLKQQAPSFKLQASIDTSDKRQAPSCKLLGT